MYFKTKRVSYIQATNKSQKVMEIKHDKYKYDFRLPVPLIVLLNRMESYNPRVIAALCAFLVICCDL